MRREFERWSKDNGEKYKRRQDADAAFCVWVKMQKEIDALKLEYKNDLLEIKAEIKRLI